MSCPLSHNKIKRRLNSTRSRPTIYSSIYHCKRALFEYSVFMPTSDVTLVSLPCDKVRYAVALDSRVSWAVFKLSN